MRLVPLLLLLLVLPFSLGADQIQGLPLAQAGHLDLSSWSLEERPTISLRGEWDFFPHQLFSPEDLEESSPDPQPIQAPKIWRGNRAGQIELQGQGVGTYRLHLMNLPKNVSLGLRIPLIHSAYLLWIDGKLVSERGRVGTNAKETLPAVGVDRVYFSTFTGEITLVMQVANFKHHDGGFFDAFQVGPADIIRHRGYWASFLDSWFLTAFVVIGLYHLLLFISLPAARYAIYFSLACLLLGLRAAVQNEMLISQLFPELNYEVGYKISYLTYYFTAPVMVTFYAKLYPQDFPKLLLRLSQAGGLGFSALTLLAPANFYTAALVYFHPLALLSVGLVIFGIARAVMLGRDFAGLILYGSLVMAVTVVNDILYGMHLVRFGPFASYGMLVFIVFQSYVNTKQNTAMLLEGVMRDQENQELKLEINKRKVVEMALRNNELELVQAKEEAEASRQQILDSIHYAQEIQKALLPKKQDIQLFLPDHFIFWQPRDIVGGDLYFVEPCQGGLIIGVIDCTGHGVPGAFMTMIASSSLVRIIRFDGTIQPDQILTRLNLSVKSLMQQKGDHLMADEGLDAAFCLVDYATNQLMYAGAKIPLFECTKGELKIHKADRTSLGYQDSDLDHRFELHSIPLTHHQRFYLATDGFQDQTGGEKGFPLGGKRLRAWLAESSAMGMNQQCEYLQMKLIRYRGDLPPVDDMTILGFSLEDLVDES